MVKNFSLSLIVILILFFTFFGKNGFLELVNFQSRYDELQQKLTSLESTIQEESDTLFGLSESPEYLEQVAREDLGLSREGEIIYIFDPKSKERKLKEKNQE